MKFKLHSCTLLVLLWTLPMEAIPTKHPFTLVGKLIVIQATVDGITGNFILDTGISNLVLNTEYYQGLPIDRVFHGINGKVCQVQASYFRLELSTLKWKGLYAEIIPLHTLERTTGMPIHGLIGGKLFRKHCLWLDYTEKAIWLDKASNFRATNPFPGKDLKAVHQQKFRYKADSPCLSVNLAKRSYLFSLDTGAEVNVLDQQYKDELKAYYREKTHKALYSFKGDHSPSSFVRLNGLHLGNYACKPMQAAFFDLSQWNRQTIGPAVDGILGYEFLHQFRVCINFKDRQIYLLPIQKPMSREIFKAKK